MENPTASLPTEEESARVSLKALGRSILAMGSAVLGSMVILENPVVDELLPWFLGGAAILLGVNVWRMDARPRNRWRGLAATAMVIGFFVLLWHSGLLR